MKITVSGLSKLPEIRTGYERMKGGFFFDIFLPKGDSGKGLHKIHIPDGFKLISQSVSDGGVITILCQTPASIHTVEDLLATKGQIHFEFV